MSKKRTALMIGALVWGAALSHCMTGAQSAGPDGRGSLSALAGAEVISAARRIDWSRAGVVGGIPSGRWPPCGPTIEVGASAAVINAAIQKCAQNHVVMLGAGTFKLSSGIVMKSGVALRGRGADQTSLVFAGANPCGGTWAAICFFGGDSNDWFGSASVLPGGSKSAIWESGYARGSTEIILNGIGNSGVSVGHYIHLDQENDTAPGEGLFVCENVDARPPCSMEGGLRNPGRVVAGIARQQVQIVKITNCAPSCSNGSTFTISPGLYASNWDAKKKPGAWWFRAAIENAGVEELTIDSTDSGGQMGVSISNAANVWLTGTRNIRVCSCARSIVHIASATQITIENNYFYGTSGRSVNYGVETYIASDSLIANNIFQHVVAPILIHSNQGSVYAFNFAINNTYDDGRAPKYHWMMPMVNGHSGGVMYLLFEGNVGPGIGGDYFHGNQVLNTVFRNFLSGSDPGRIDNAFAIRLDPWNRYWNIIGNVLGTAGYTSSYAEGNPAVYSLGRGHATMPDDRLVAKTTMRWGNYDVAGQSTRWDPTEVPAGIGHYANPVPQLRGLPDSLFYSSKPAWWPERKPWPAIGPDVAGGDIPGTGGHAYTIPAQDCYAAMGGPVDGSGDVLKFNAKSCYGRSAP